ncbi:MAG: helix-turn-helix domain-containing protein [Rickettsiaceae bacterium H1]|nr:helix-turn-helix domain-containing protein [Rickettsiaceae bacterium H1]
MTDNLLMVNKIKQRMSEVGINAKQLAEKAEVGKSFVYDILNGKSKNPTSNKLSSISKHLGIPVSYLMNGDENNIDLQKYLSVRPLLEKVETNDLSILLLKSLFKPISNYEKFYSFSIDDDSMEPTFYNSDVLIINKLQNKQHSLGFFLIKDEFSTTVRRVEHIIGSTKLRVIADNSKYATYEQEINKIQLIGKVLWYLRTM